jgi:hypothetical protein
VAPNPVFGAGAVSLTLRVASTLRVELYDALGREAIVLHEGPLGAGVTSLPLDASRLTPGVYVVRALGSAWSASARLIVLGPLAR